MYTCLFPRFFLLLVISLICLEASNIREGRITGGREAEPHSNPYVVSLQTRFLWTRYRLCTGSILSERWILSAGHCVMDSWARWLAMDAIVGAHNLEYIRSSQIYPISHRIAHPMYRGGVGPYDIAMMRTSRDIEFSEEVQPISLPLVPPTDETAREQDLLITGWGALKSTFFVTVVPKKLQEAEVTYLPYYECYRAVDKLKEYYEPNPLKRIHNLCTGPISGGIAGCTGDSGGPLVQYVPMMVPQTMPNETTIDREETTTSVMSTSTENASTASPTQITTDRTSTTTATFVSPTQMSTDRTSTTTAATFVSPTQMSTDRTSTTMSHITTVSIETYTDEPTTAEYITTGAETDAIPNGRHIYGTNEIKYSSYNKRSGDERALRVDMMPTVIGVISWGVVPCGKRGAPTVYSNVTNYMDFINKYLLSN